MAVIGTRARIVMQVDRLAIAESHVLAGNNSLADALIQAKILATARQRLLGYPGKLISVTVSNEGIFRDSQTIKRPDLMGNDPGDVTFSSNPPWIVTNHSDQPKAAIQLRLQGSDERFGTVYLAGVPDILITEGPEGPVPSAAPGWWEAFQAYRAVLIGPPKQWGFISKIVDATVTKLTQVTDAFNNDINGLLTVVTTSGGLKFNPGNRVQLLNFKRTHVAFKSANGQWIVDTAEANTPSAGKETYTFRNSASVPATQITDMGQIQLVDYEVLKYSDVKIVGQTTRKRGNRLLAGPGRLRKVKPLPT